MSGGHPALQRYELVERIAKGGMGEVFRATAYGADGFEKVIAIKRILPSFAADPAYARRFADEAKLAVALTHGNVVQVLDFGRLEGSLFIAMELVDGPEVGTLLAAARDRGQRVPVAAALQIAIEVCKGLDFAHRLGVIHRDISPSNILLSRAGEVKIADFGIAKVMDPGRVTSTIAGKWGYMAPEQARGEVVDARSDLYAAAVVIHEMLTGERLFPDAETAATVDLGPTPRPSTRRPELPRELDDILVRALARDPAERYLRVAALLRSLMEVCYAHKLAPTPLDVADAVERFVPRADVPPAVPLRVIDRAIFALLGGAPGSGAGESGPAEPLDASASVRTTFSFVRAPAADGELPSLQLAPNDAPAPAGRTPTVRTVASRPPRPAPAAAPSVPAARRSRIPVWIVIGAIVTAGAAIGVVLALRTSPPSASAPIALAPPDAPAAAAPPDAPAAAPIAIDAAPSIDATPPARDAAKVEYATIAVHAEPWADVYLRGRKVGTAPDPQLRLPVGTHRLRLVNPVLGRETTLSVTVPSKTPYRLTW